MSKFNSRVLRFTHIMLTPTPPVELSCLDRSATFKPHQVRQEIVRLFEENQPRPNANRWRLSVVAKSLTFRAQTRRGSDNGCAIKRTPVPRYAQLIQLVHQLAQAAKDQDSGISVYWIPNSQARTGTNPKPAQRQPQSRRPPESYHEVWRVHWWLLANVERGSVALV